MAQIMFDATQVAPQESLSPIPAGTYLAHIIDSEVRPLKSGMGQALALTFEVLDGPYRGRKVFTQLNVQHRGSPDAERIAQAQLSALCHATGVLKLSDSTQLHMRPVRIRVKIRKDETGQYGDRNEVTGYEAAPGAAVPPMAAPAAAMPAAASAAAPAAAAAQAATPPWAKRAA